MRKIFTSLIISLLTGLAFAGSTINPSVPATNSSLTSAPLRANFLAAYTDINSILGAYAGTTAPPNPSTYQYWMDTSVSPFTLKIYDSASWVSIGKLDISAHTWSPVGAYTGGTIAAAYGGTGHATYAIGDLLYASGATTLSRLAGVATGNALISGGVATAPAWGKIALTTHVSGTLPVANGGTGATVGSGTVLDSVSGFASTGFITRTGSGAYGFQSATNGITLGNLAQIASNTIVGNNTSATADQRTMAVPSCSAASSALTWTTSTGFGCNTVVSAASPTFTGTTTLTGLLDISGAAAGQIKFPATQNASADVNTLDDYKEGSFTTTFSCSGGGTITLGNNGGSYTKIGNAVFFTGLFDVSSVSAPSGVLTATGLPYTSGNNNRNYSAMAVHISGGTGAVTGNVWQARIIKNTTGIVVSYMSPTTGTEGSNACAQMQAGSSVTVSGHYMVN